MDSSFGARLRTQRERRQVALATIADHTKIKLPLLEGLERDDVSHWPSGIFRRAYVRAYAQAIGLEPDAVLKEFLERHPEPVEEAPAAVAAMRAVEASSKRPPTRLRYLIESAFGALPTLRPQPPAGSPEIYRGDSGAAGVRRLVEPERDVRGAEGAFEDAAFERGYPEPGPSIADERRHDTPVSDVPPAGIADRDEYSFSAPVHETADDSPLPDLPFEPPIDRLADPVDFSGSAIGMQLDLAGLARICFHLARVVDGRDVEPLLDEAARVLHAEGLILWISDPSGGVLRPVLGHGYAPEVLARLPHVNVNEDNAIAVAFRAAEPRVVNGSEHETGAIVVPLPTPAGCAGVLALELRDRGEQREPLQAAAAIVAAQLASVVGHPVRA